MEELYFRKKDDYFTIMLIQQNYNGKNRARFIKVFSDDRQPEVKDVVSDEDKLEYGSAIMSLPTSDWFQVNPEKLAPSEIVSILEAFNITPQIELSEDIEDQLLEQHIEL